MAFRARQFTASDGLSLHFRDYGSEDGAAIPLLCLSGLTRNSADFHEFALRHAVARRIVCPDYRGRGLSDYDPEWRNYRPETYLDDIRTLLASLNIHRVAVVGTSLGGLLAMAMAVLMPRVIGGAVLNDVGPELAGDGLSRILDYIGKDRPQVDWNGAMECVRQLFPGLANADENALRKAAEGAFRQGKDGLLHFNWDVNIARNLKAGAAIPDLWPLFRALAPRPVLAVRGALSDVLSPSTFARMKVEMPGLEQYEAEGCGHAPALDEPGLTETVDAFLARL